MGKKKLKNPYTIHSAAGKKAGVLIESSLALKEYEAKMKARRELAINKEILDMTEQRDAFQENWMWGLFALVLHRRYHYTAGKIAEILTEVQTLHNDIYDGTRSYEETDRIIVDMVKDEVGLDITSADLEQYKKRRRI